MSNFIFYLFLVLGLDITYDYQDFTVSQHNAEQNPRECAMYTMSDEEVLKNLPSPQTLNIVDITGLRNRLIVRYLFAARDAKTSEQQAEYIIAYFKYTAASVSNLSGQLKNPPRTWRYYSMTMDENIKMLVYNMYVKGPQKQISKY